MEQQITSIIEYMARSHQEMSELLEKKRDIAVHMASVILEIPDVNVSFAGVDAITKNAMAVTENITSYLTTIADFEEAIAENLSYVMKEMNASEEHEE